MRIKKILSMVLVLMMFVSLLPTAGAEWTVPENYGEDEYNQLAAFFETEDADGVKNGTKLNEDYDVNDPNTWGDGWVFMPFDPPYHVMNIGWEDSGLVGSLDVSSFPELSGLYLSNNDITAVDASNCPELGDVECAYGAFESLNFSGCESLSNLICDDNQLTSLNVSGCSGLTASIFCDNNRLTELDISDCIQLKTLVCSDNLLEDLNVSNCAALTTLNAQNNALSTINLSDCANLKVLNLSGNKLKNIDMSACTNLHLNSVTAKGPGTVGYWETLQGSNSLIILYATADRGKSFLGWYNAAGDLLSTEAEWNISSIYETVGTEVTAKFAGTMDSGYYLIGRNGWTLADIGAEDKFSTNSGASTEEYKLITTLEEGQEIKVVKVSNGNELNPWYPEGDNYTVDAAHAGTKIIYFRPNYNSDWQAFGGYMWIDDPPTYHVYFDQPAHGTLVADKVDAMEGETITITAVPDSGYYPAQSMTATPIPSNTSFPDDFHYCFTMPASDVTVSIGWNQMCVDQGFYYSVDTSFMDLAPSQKFSEVSSAYGEYEFETVLEEGKSLSLTRILTVKGWTYGTLRWDWSTEVPWTEGDDHWLITAEKAGHAKIFLTGTKDEGYTKAFDKLSYQTGTTDMWLIVKYYQPITVLPTEHGTVTAPADAFEDETVMLTVTPDEGYMLDMLTVTDANGNLIELHGVSGTNFYMPATAVTVSATFKPTAVSAYTVTLVGAREGVTITSTKETAQEGDNVDVNIQTDSYHRFVSITVTDEQGNEIDTTKRPDGANKYRFVMPASNVTVTVVTKEIYPLTLVNNQVDEFNCTDILGDGTAIYDPATRTLSFSSANPNFGTDYGSALIYWTGEDSLTVSAPNGLDLAGNTTYCLYATSGDVIINGNVILDIPDESNGIWCMKTLTINGDVSGTVKAIALYGLNGITVNGNVNITNQEGIRTAYSTGAVSISGDFTAVGWGIDAVGGISIGGDVTITSSGTNNVGIQSTNGAITVGSGTWDITASTNPLKAAGGIVIPDDHSIVLPEGGVLGTLSESGTSYTVVYESDGTTLATHVIISGQTEPTGYHINVTDYTKGKATTSLVADQLYSGEVTFTVSCSDICKVGLVNAGGTITKLACTTTDDVHSFTVTVTDADVNLVIVIKGDANLDGNLRGTDATYLKKYFVDLVVMDESTAAVQAFAGDVNDDGSLKGTDATMISKYFVDLVTLSW